MQSLEQYGWNTSFHSHIQSRSNQGAIPGRVVSIKGFKHEVVTGNDIQDCTLAGRLMFGALPEELPKVGDWVLCVSYGAEGYIVDVLPRMNELSRRAPGARTERQVLAANLDGALVVQGLDRDFNIMRLDRYLVQLAACLIPAVVVLNKCDLVNELSEQLAQIENLRRPVVVRACSTYTGAGISELLGTVLLPGKTYALIGSSGVGKSSLLNAWKGTHTQTTTAIGEGTQKGKHTTTSRELFMLPNGSLVIDTPGMREFGVTLEENADPDEMFPAIAEAAQRCRYNDCSHLGEEGCAVLEALGDGSLDSTVYESFIKLIKEQRRFQVKAEDKKQMEKQFGKMSREASNHRKKYKF